MNSALPMRLSGGVFVRWARASQGRLGGLLVREPSSMMRQVMWPSLRISPVCAGTWLMGTRGIFMVARAWRASSSMVAVESLGCTEMVGMGGERWEFGEEELESDWECLDGCNTEAELKAYIYTSYSYMMRRAGRDITFCKIPADASNELV